MPHSVLKCIPIWMDKGVSISPCGQSFKFESARERNMKMGMHKKPCCKLEGSRFVREPRKAVTLKEAQHMTAERMREFYK